MPTGHESCESQNFTTIAFFSDNGKAIAPNQFRAVRSLTFNESKPRVSAEASCQPRPLPCAQEPEHATPSVKQPISLPLSMERKEQRFMVRSLSALLSLAVLLGSAGPFLAQTKVAPLYSLPANGV